MTVKTYDPTQHTINCAGIPINKGFAEDEFFKFSPEAPLFKDVVGADGTVTRVKIKDKRATVTITLMQTADANDLLSALAILDAEADNEAGVGPFLMKDRRGRSVISGADCWVQKLPDVTLGNGATARAWEIRIAEAKVFIGGN